MQGGLAQQLRQGAGCMAAGVILPLARIISSGPVTGFTSTESEIYFGLAKAVDVSTTQLYCVSVCAVVGAVCFKLGILSF